MKKSDKFAAKVRGSMSNSMELENQNDLEMREAKTQKTGCAGCLEKMTPFILLIGLGVHSIFEGLSLGLNQHYKETAVMGLAIILHKGAAGMSLGISMQKTFAKDENSTNFIISMMVLFAFMTPLGVFMGWIIAEGEHPLLEIICASLAAGTFLYIACSEIIVEEFS